VTAPDGERLGALGRALRAAGRGLLALPRGAGLVLAVLWLGVIRWLGQGRGGLSHGVTWLSWGLNTGHALLYGILALWLLLLLPRSGGWPRIDAPACRALLASVFTFGFAEEVIQAFIPGRNGSLLDVLTDLVGAACVLAVAAHLGRADVDERGLRRRLRGGVVLSLLAGGAATLLPVLLPRAAWL
jgi:hypothetical protein